MKYLQKIMCLLISIAFLFTNNVYALPLAKSTLRPPIKPIMADEVKKKMVAQSVLIHANREDMGEAAAIEVWEDISRALKEPKKRNVSLVLASAPSQREFLKKLATLINSSYNELGEEALARLHIFHLDQYVGLENKPKEYHEPCDFAVFLTVNFFSSLDAKLHGQIKFHPIRQVGKGMKGDRALLDTAKAECERYEKEIESIIGKEGKFDVTVFGIGDEKVHIAFIESENARMEIQNGLIPVKVKKKQQVTDGMFANEGDVPEWAISMTLYRLIQGSKKMVGVIPTLSKAESTRRMLEGPANDPESPASFVRSKIYENPETVTIHLTTDSAAFLADRQAEVEQIIAGRTYKALQEIWDPIFWDSDNNTSRDPKTIKLGNHPLVPVVCEVGSDSVAKKVNLGSFYLPKALTANPELLQETKKTAEGMRKRLSDAYGTDVEYIIWPGMGGSIEDKYASIATGALPGVKGKNLAIFALDNVDPETIKFIWDKIAKSEQAKNTRNKLDYEESLLLGLKKTVVVAQALGMTSYEPVFNADKFLKPMFQKRGLELEKHFYKITIDGSYVDTSLEGCTRIVHQPDQPEGRPTTSGRHDAPFTNGILLPLALAGVDLQKWVEAGNIQEREVKEKSMALAAWAVLNEKRGVNKIVFSLPKEWQGDVTAEEGAWQDAGLWFKQLVEESLGKSRKHLLKIVTDDDLSLKNSEPAGTDRNDKAFLVVRVKGLTNVSERKIAELKGAGYSVMVMDFDDNLVTQQLKDKVLLARLMEVFHWAVFGMAQNWNICAVDQPAVEFYKKIVDWMRGNRENFDTTINRVTGSKHQATNGKITLNWHALAERGLVSDEEIGEELRRLSTATKSDLDINNPAHVAAAIHSIALKKMGDDGRPEIQYGELIHFGETSYTDDGLAMRDNLIREGDDALWRKTLKKFADVGKGPGSGHAYHAMIKAAQRCLTTSLIAMDHIGKPEDSDYLKMHWLGNLLALSGYDIKLEQNQKLEEGKLAASDRPGWAMSIIFDKNYREALIAYFREVAKILNTVIEHDKRMQGDIRRQQIQSFFL